MIGTIEISRLKNDYGLMSKRMIAVSYLANAPEGTISDIVESTDLKTLVKLIHKHMSPNATPETKLMVGKVEIEKPRKTLDAIIKQISPILDSEFKLEV